MKAHIYTCKTEKGAVKVAIQLCIAGGIVFALVYGFLNISETAESENLAMTERAVRAALVNCYAIEGFYPTELSYLEEHYGLRIDHGKYIILYDFVFANFMPSVRIIPISERTESEVY
jgi:predicted urease superfamily metal-dependent hydrolase